MTAPTSNRVRRRSRRAFNLIELLIALAITASLLTATMAALDASFTAYQRTTENASTTAISRLIITRIMTLIRTSDEFAPFPTNPTDTLIEETFIEFRTPDNDVLHIEWVENPDPGLGFPVGNALYMWAASTPQPQLLLEGVIRREEDIDGDGVLEQIFPFTLEWEPGRILHKATIDLTVIPDDNQSLTIEGDYGQELRLVSSARPRREAFNDDQ